MVRTETVTMFPGAQRSSRRATIYGPLPTHGSSSIALVFHTTETKGIPSFSGGDTAPHYVYDAVRNEWWEWADPASGYVGTMKGHSVGHYNCRALQVEIVAYSDRSVASSVGGLWIGDLSDVGYGELSRFVEWARSQHGIGDAVTATPAGGWLYGTSSRFRMTEAQWRSFSGVTAHGAVPGNTHWDTGVLDLVRVATGKPGEAPPPATDEGGPMWPMYLTDGYASPTGNGRTEWRENVIVLQAAVNAAGGAVSEDGKLGPSTLAAVRDLTGIATTGDSIGGAHYVKLIRMTDLGEGSPVGPHSHTFSGTTSTS